MKKIITLLLAVTIILSLCACGQKVTYQLNDTVSTDIVDLTLKDSQLTYYVSNISSNFAEPINTPNSMFAAKTGTCYVSMTVTITNKDRGGSINFAGGFSSWNPAEWTVTYGGKEYELYGFDLNSSNYKKIDLSNGAVVRSDGTFYRKDTGNALISAGATITLRFFGIIKVDPASLNDSFELNVKLPNSGGKFENFTYAIPARS